MYEVLRLAAAVGIVLLVPHSHVDTDPALGPKKQLAFVL